MKSIITFTVAFIICFIANSQTTETFKKIDAKYSFKDVVLGTSYNLLKVKMGLKEVNSVTHQFKITNKKYLSIGYFNAHTGYAYFSKNKLYNIQLFVKLNSDDNFEQMLNYFIDLFGTPNYIKDNPFWLGSKLSYSLLHAVAEQEVIISVTSLLINPDLGEDNF